MNLTGLEAICSFGVFFIFPSKFIYPKAIEKSKWRKCND
jgi:hypothetical protein